MSTANDRSEATQRAKASLRLLSIGDAFGERFFRLDVLRRIYERALPPGPWGWTDDTAMAISVVEVLLRHGEIRQSELAVAFAVRYRANPMRGYGRGAHGLLEELGRGVPWQVASSSLFGGSGSYGNGAAMRVAPLGAYFADDLAAAAREGARASEVTHAHPDGVAGGVAVAVAAAFAHAQGSQAQGTGGLADRAGFFEAVLDHLDGPFAGTKVRRNVEAARDAPLDLPIDRAAELLGSGTEVAAQDTVGFCLYMAARCPRDFEEAMWLTVSGLGDRDTTCAIVAGILGATAPPETLPAAWEEATEPLPPELRPAPSPR